MRLKKGYVVLFLLMFGLLFSFSCGDDGTECGEGTHEENGKCVPDKLLECAQGTHEENGKCVPDEVIHCGEGTILDERSGTCLVDYDALCPNGFVYDVAEAGCIIPENRVNVTEGHENNDPFTDGNPTQFSLPQGNETIIISGNIDPPNPRDLDEDGYPDPDFDVFEFEATAGQVIQIEGTSGPNLPSVAFAIIPKAYIENEGDYPIPPRYAIAATGRNPMRKFRMLQGGTYWLMVTDKDNLIGSRMTGGENMRYYIAVSVLTPPSDANINIGESVTVPLEDNLTFYNIQGATSGKIIQFKVEDPSSTATQRYLYLLDSTNTILNYYFDQLVWFFYIPIGTQRYKLKEDGLKFFLDYIANLSGDDSYKIEVSEVQVTDLGELSSNHPISGSGYTLSTYDEMDTFSFRYTQPQGNVYSVATFRVTSQRNFPAYIILRDADYEVISHGESPYSVSGLTTGNYYIDVMFGGDEDEFRGPYDYGIEASVLVIQNQINEQSGDHSSPQTAQVIDPNSLPLVVNGRITSQEEDYYSITPTSNLSINIVLDGDTNFDAVLRLLDSNGELIDEVDSGFEDDPESISYNLTANTTYYIVASEYGRRSGSYQLILINQQ